MHTQNPEIIREAERQEKILAHGTVQVVPQGGLKEKLIAALTDKRPLKIKLGADPTAPDLHLGHAVILQKMRQFQDLGHHVQLLIGDYTARIGDPSGRSKTRPPLDGDAIDANAKTYTAQAFKILDNNPAKLSILYNGSWLAKLTFADTLKLCSQVTVAQLMVREDFAERFTDQTPIAMHELLYPIMQGYDSVAMQCDIELGGTDQTFNCLMGRDLQSAYGQPPQVVMTFPLLEGTDGVKKMSKSLGNYIGINDAPSDMFGKVMSIPDSVMDKYFDLLTAISKTERPTHPMETKKLLGRTLVARFHNEQAAQKAQTDFEARFSRGEKLDDLPIIHVPSGPLPAVVSAAFNISTSEARRRIEAGSVKINGEKMTDITAALPPASEPLWLQSGKSQVQVVIE